MFAKFLHILDFTRRAVLGVIFLLMLGVLAVVFITMRPSVPEHAVLVLDPKGALVEELAVPGSAFPLAMPAAEQARMRDLVRAIHAARDDRHIRMILLDLKDLDRAPLTKLQALRRAIDDFKTGGKKVIASANSYTQTQYYLAASADTVYLHPMGMVLCPNPHAWRIRPY